VESVDATFLDEPQMSMRGYIDVLLRHRWIVAACFLAALATAVGASLWMPPVYQASTTVTADKVPPVVLLDRPGEFSIFADQAAAQAPNVSTLAELIRSDAVRAGASAMLATTVGADAEHVLDSGMDVRPIRNTDLVRISVEHTNPRLAAAAADALANSLIDLNLKSRRQRATETRQFIEGQLAQASQELRAGEDALVRFKDQFGNIALMEDTSITVQKLAALEAQQVDLQLQKRELEERIAWARAHGAGHARITPTQSSENQLVTGLQNTLAALEIERAGLRQQLTSQHPAVVATEAKIAETRNWLDAALTRDQAALDARERDLTGAIAHYAEKIRGVPSREVELARLMREAKKAEEVYLLLSQRLQEAGIAEASIGSAIRVVDVAKVPHAPIRPRRQMNTLFGAVLGLMIGGLAAFVKDQIDDTVQSSEEVERVLKAPVLGAIPILGGPGVSGNGPGRDGGGLLVLAGPGAQERAAWRVVEAYLALRTHVLFSLPDAQHKHLMVTSALSSEGKSTVAMNLAIAIARTGRRVWLVDGDLRRRTLQRFFSTNGSPGLATFLAGQADVNDVVCQADEPNLWFLPSGPTVPNPTELLGAQRMKQLMDEARAHSDVLILDSPPALPVTDAEVAGAQVDGALVVVKVGVTSRRSLKHVRQRLEGVGIKIVGAVLNFVPARSGDAYYYDTYYNRTEKSKKEDRQYAARQKEGKS